MPCIVILTRAVWETTRNDEYGSLPIKLGRPRRKQTDCEVRYGQQ